MPIDYSKFNNIDVSDDDDDDVQKKLPQKKVEKVAAVKPVTLEKPKEAQGSAWNANNYHFEEQKLDTWGRARFKALLKEKAHTELKHAGQTFPLSIEFGVDKMDADIWSHIRKGKTAVGYNIELEMGVSGTLQAGSRKEEVLGSLTADLMVDNEPEVSLSLSKGDGLPFTREIIATIKGDLIRRFNAFVLELKDKADAHKNKVP